MATVESTREERTPAGAIGWDGHRLDEMLSDSERLFAETGRYAGLHELQMMSSDPIGYEKLFSRIRGGLVSARETALNISASPIVRELGELCFALYTPEGDSLALSTGIIVHVHTMSDAIKWMVRNGMRTTPASVPETSSPTTTRPSGTSTTRTSRRSCRSSGGRDGRLGGRRHPRAGHRREHPWGCPGRPTMRYEDGIDLPCMKIGENDELARWHLERCSKRTRASLYYLLDERTRLADAT